MADTGNSATIAFSTSAFVADFSVIGANEQSLDKVEVSHLATTGYKEFIPGDLADPGEVECEVLFDSKDDLPTLGTVETITITFPLQVVGKTAGKLAGTGWISKASTPQLKNNEVQSAKITITFDGKTGPAFTKETA